MSDKLPISIRLPDAFFAEETRNDYVITSDIKKVWAIELDLLSEFEYVGNTILNIWHVVEQF